MEIETSDNWLKLWLKLGTCTEISTRQQELASTLSYRSSANRKYDTPEKGSFPRPRSPGRRGRVHIIDSGASLHMTRIVSEWMSRSQGRATVYVSVSICLKLVDDSPVVFSLRLLCEEMESSYSWNAGTQPLLTPSGVAFERRSDNHAPIVAVDKQTLRMLMQVATRCRTCYNNLRKS